jgi:hypothetical protein
MNRSAGYRWLNLALSLIAIRYLPHAVASDRRVIWAALHQSIVRALSNGAARCPIGFIGLGTM